MTDEDQDYLAALIDRGGLRERIVREVAGLRQENHRMRKLLYQRGMSRAERIKWILEGLDRDSLDRAEKIRFLTEILDILRRTP